MSSSKRLRVSTDIPSSVRDKLREVNTDNLYSVRQLVRENEFVLPNIDPIRSYLSPDILPRPYLLELINVVPTGINNLYNADLRPLILLPRILGEKPQPVSFVVMKGRCSAFFLEKRMQEVASIAGKDIVLGSKFVLNRIPLESAGSDHPVLLTEAIPTQTVFQFLADKPSLAVRREFFKKLWSALNKLHEAKTYFGNLCDGLRVLDNKPILTFPAIEGDVCSGIRNDLLHVIFLAIEAFSELVIEMRCFLSICRDVINSNNFKALRRGSFFILHHNLVWAPEDCARFVLRLHEYFQSNPSRYHRFVSDGAIDGYPHYAVDYNWKGILDQHVGYDEVMNVFADSHYKDAITGNSGVYDNSESLRYFIRCKLSHLPPTFPVERMINSVMDVFPEAMARLYLMAYRRFQFQGWLKNFQRHLKKMPNFIEFFKFGPGKHNAFQF